MIATDLHSILSEIYTAAKDEFHGTMQNMILYGSYARGDFDAESDMDIMILADIRNDECWIYRKKLSSIVDELSLEHDIVISLHILDTTTFERWNTVVPFYQNVKREGVVIRA